MTSGDEGPARPDDPDDMGQPPEPPITQARPSPAPPAEPPAPPPSQVGGPWQGTSPPPGPVGGYWQGTTQPPAGPGPWQVPTQPPTAPRRGRWMFPVMAIVVALGVAAGTFTFMMVRDEGGRPLAVPSTGTSPGSAASPASGAANADACAMIDPVEAERLVPGAKIDSRTSDNRNDSLVSYVRWTCGWANRNISYKDVTRSREITVNIARYEAIGSTTADKSARIQYDGELRQYKYGASVSDKERYYSTPVELTGVGDAAAAQYQWVREKDYWYSFGQGVGRIGNVVFQVKYEAGQQNKEADLFSTDTKQSITEENAIRVVKGLLSQLAQSVAAWQEGRPLPFHARPKASPSPSVSPTPTRIPLPQTCVSVNPLAARLVPGTEGAAARSTEGRATVTECQWWNDKLPLSQGKIRWRNLRVSVRSFADAGSARYFLIDQRGKNKFTAGSTIGGIRWSRMQKLSGLGQDGFGQAIRQRTQTAQSNRYEIYVLDGKNVVWVLFGGSDRPQDTPINSTDSTLMDMKDATAGARSVAEGVLKAF